MINITSECLASMAGLKMEDKESSCSPYSSLPISWDIEGGYNLHEKYGYHNYYMKNGFKFKFVYKLRLTLQAYNLGIRNELSIE